MEESRLAKLSTILFVLASLEIVRAYSFKIKLAKSTDSKYFFPLLVFVFNMASR